MRSRRRDAEMVRQVPLQWPGAILRLRPEIAPPLPLTARSGGLASTTDRSTKPAIGCTLSLTTKCPLQSSGTENAVQPG